MGRPPSITDEAILEAAATVFLGHGMRGTTADVAHVAGISEGIIFKRFGTKDELFRRAIQKALVAQQHLMPEVESWVGKGEIDRTLYNLCWAMVDRYRVIIPLVTTGFEHSPEGKLPPELDSPEPMPIRWIKRLSRYFQGEMDLGRLRALNPEVLARTTAGAIWNFVFFEVAMPGKLPLDAEVFVRGLVDLLLLGAASPAPAAPDPGGRPAHRPPSARSAGRRS